MKDTSRSDGGIRFLMKFGFFIRQEIEEAEKKNRLVSLFLYVGTLIFLMVLVPQEIVFENLPLRIFILVFLALIFSWCSYKAVESMGGNHLPNEERTWEIVKWWISVFLSLMLLAYYLGLFRSDIWP